MLVWSRFVLGMVVCIFSSRGRCRGLEQPVWVDGRRRVVFCFSWIIRGCGCIFGYGCISHGRNDVTFDVWILL
ncbi:hypothetical protein QBC39DRAFT_342777 [Podospora conica]|nr:hypothetical protein QBC39DRAFT_342777 [Schizothecium conicum]